MAESLLAQNNLIRAGVMGGNDGILSIAGIIIGVAAAGQSRGNILLAAFAGTLAGMVSMAMGEYVSVRSNHDAQQKARLTQQAALVRDYDGEFDFVRQKYVTAGIAPELAERATQEMMAQDPLGTTVRERFGFSLGSEISAFGAALVSFLTFPAGAAFPMAWVAFAPRHERLAATFLAVLLALLLTGYVAALVNGANRRRGALRNLLAGLITMLATFGIGCFFH
ncbi:VIT family protein [Leuconostocaceae bacterium ESL0958]|nr:VIT family protein [Leuconostocaceae bacterium ESL0958]